MPENINNKNQTTLVVHCSVVVSKIQKLTESGKCTFNYRKYRKLDDGLNRTLLFLFF